VQDPNQEETARGVDEITSICDQFGYGNVMDTASTLWQQKLGINGGGANSVGPCIASLVSCGCQSIVRKKCDWCAGTGKITKRVKQARDEALGKVLKSNGPERSMSRYLYASLYHISEKDNLNLRWGPDPANDVTNYRIHNGVFICVDQKRKLTEYKMYSQAFKDLIKIAKKLECEYIKLHHDGPVYDDITLFDW